MYCFGRTSWNDFALTPRSMASANQENISNPFFSQKKISGLACRDGVVAFVHEHGSGELWIEEDTDEQAIQGRLMEMKLPKDDKIKVVDCGKSSVLVLSDTGKLYEWIVPKYQNLPKAVNPRIMKDLEGTCIIQVACGDDHHLALSKDGRVFAWDNNQIHSGSVLLRSLCGVPVAQIAAGGNHSFVLSVSGTVYGWGRNNAGQLGLGDTNDRATPVLVTSLEFKGVSFISCGDEHTAVLTKDGLVFTFGAGDRGQLGHNSTRNEVRPRLVTELWGQPVSQIACGRRHTLALTHATGKLHTFGCVHHKQLGRRTAGSQSVPMPVKLPSEKRFSLMVDRIFAGGDQSFILCLKKKDAEPLETFRTLLPGKRISRMDHSMLKKWTAKSEGKSRKAVKADIELIFSSAACVNASFLSQDHHLRSSIESLGLDLPRVRETFKILSESNLLLPVKAVVQRRLLPNQPTEPASTEVLRVYLIVTELIDLLRRKKYDIGTITAIMAAAILRQNSRCSLSLESLWRKIPPDAFEKLVLVCRDASSQLMFLQSEGSSEALQNTLSVLQKLSNANSATGWRIPKTTFHIDIGKSDQAFLFDQYPCILDMDTKLFLLRTQAQRMTSDIFVGDNTLLVNRETILADTLQVLKQNTFQYWFPLKVQFAGENGIDAGGLKREFFKVLARELYGSADGMFQVDDSSGLLWFRQEEGSELYHLIGLLCGLALYNDCVADFHFPLALYKKLLGFEVTLEDLEELSPTVGRSLQEILNDDYIDLQDNVFIWGDTELIPGGEDILVTKHNRQKYVDACVDHLLNKSIQMQFEAFKHSFQKACPNPMWTLFLPEELKSALCGSTKFDWEHFEKITRYEEYDSEDPTIRNFWTMFHRFTEDQKTTFMAFLTGSNRRSAGSRQMCRMTIRKNCCVNPDEYYPEASTCYHVLTLPDYSSKTVLEEKCLRALNFHEGFGKN
ncbi:probable E3 ubiquitin-protein ligase HERC4 isoform X1 [Polypterus senegalus]|uniref:probable E3 ubiquitin-protein ligase HERC4 isoform X1 n=1 Tax=Polypterus senegalus TaxID=55291 RepID=UPI00196515ED|nr:probable E3 ubiquitin-protein ligase HERC4 isoform X1 [Polypterus senegalus]